MGFIKPNRVISHYPFDAKENYKSKERFKSDGKFSCRLKNDGAFP